MASDRIRIDGKTFILTPGQDIAELKRSIVAAANAGAGFVDFSAAGGHTVSALISPGVSIRIERTEDNVDNVIASDDALPAIYDPASLSDHYDV